MPLIRFSSILLLVTLVPRICLAEVLVKIPEPDKFAELEEATVQTLITCYPSKDKTVLLIGDFPGSFVKELSTHRSFGLVLLDSVKRNQNNIGHWREIDERKKHKVHIVVMMATHYERFINHLDRYILSVYDNSQASLIILSWAPNKKHGACKHNTDVIDTLYDAYWNNMLNANLMCYDRRNRIKVYNMNPFTSHMPEPWQFVETGKDREKQDYYLLTREYREHRGMCENLDFDKTRDLSGRKLSTVSMFTKGHEIIRNGTIPMFSPIRRIEIQELKRSHFINDFFDYVNATRIYLWRKYVPEDESALWNPESLMTLPLLLKALIARAFFTYPHGQECEFLVSHFRGHKTQLQKIISVIDEYSWMGIGIVYFITWMFFKFFLRQSPLTGILTLFRLTCGCGLLKLPSNVASQIYLSCLFMFVVTMQGIFLGNLAALLTWDIPVRQINSIQDLADLRTIRRIYVHPADYVIFENAAFDGRIHESLSGEDCLAKVVGDPSSACLTWGADRIEFALEHKLYTSPDCIAIEYNCNAIPWRWYLENKINAYLGIKIATGTMMPLHGIVDEKRFLEAESQITPPEPRIIVFRDLGFAFVILGIGLGLALVTFLIEIPVSRYQRLVATRVIFLN